jgi:hypothetical protein
MPNEGSATIRLIAQAMSEGVPAFIEQLIGGGSAKSRLPMAQTVGLGADEIACRSPIGNTLGQLHVEHRIACERKSPPYETHGHSTTLPMG